MTEDSDRIIAALKMLSAQLDTIIAQLDRANRSGK